jgi:hypothetical protein
MCQQNLARRLNTNLKKKKKDSYSHAATYPQSDGQIHVAKIIGVLFATSCRESATKMDKYHNTHIAHPKA